MLSVLLLILKIIGIILASILGLVLLLLMIILFVPIRYRLDFEKAELGNDYSVVFKASYLLHLINARFIYPGDGFRLRIAFFKLFPKKEKVEKEKRQKEKKPKKTRNETKIEADIKETVSDEEAKISIEQQSDTEALNNEEQADTLNDFKAKTDNAWDEDKDNEVKPTLSDFVDKIKNILGNIKLTATKVYDKIIDVRDNIQYYIDIIESETFKKAFKLVKKELIHIFKAIGPRKIRAEIHFGNEDPSVTGQVLGYYAMLYPILGKGISFYPDFEESKLYGKGYLKGHITLCVLLIIALKVYFNKDIKRVIKLFKKEK